MNGCDRTYGGCVALYKKVLFVREIYGFTEFLGSDLALCRKIVS